MPTLVIVAGPNGSGKTTLARSGALARVMHVPDVAINADDLARELAIGGHPTDEQSLRAAQYCDARLDAEIAAGRSVVVETVLSSDKYKRHVIAAREAGFEIVLVYVTVQSAELNVARVANRFVLGGHDVPLDRIIARRTRSHQMFEWFAKAADRVFVFDNSTTSPVIVALKDRNVWIQRRLDLLSVELADAIRALASGAAELGS